MLAYGTGFALVHGYPWDLPIVTVAVVAVALAAALGVGIEHALRRTRLRRRALAQSSDTLLATRVRRGARHAGVLRGLIGVLSLTLLALGVVIES